MIRRLIGLRFTAMLSGILSGGRGGKQRSTGMKVLMAVLFLYVIVVFFGMMGALFTSLCDSLAEAGLGWFYFSLMGIIAFALCFIGSIFAAQSQLFEAKDNAMLLAMPIKPSSILISRLAGLLLLDYMYEAVVVLPAGVVWLIKQPVTAGGVAFFILAALLLPGLALTFSCFFGWLIALISSKLRRKNIISVVLWLAFFFAYMRIYSNIGTYIKALIQNGAQIAEAVQKAVFPAYHMGVAIAETNVLSLLLFALCAVIPFAVVCLILSRSFIGLATASKGTVKIKYRERAVKSRSVRSALVRKEIARFWGSPMYIMNSSLGAVFTIAGTVLVVIKRAAVMETLAFMEPLTPAVMLCAVLCAIQSMNFISAPALSLEGKSLWIPKSLPVSPGDVLIAKAQMHQLLCVPPSILAGIVCALCFRATILQTVLLLISPCVVTAAVSYFGVFINLHFPRFDYANDTQAVKQGASGIITMFVSLACVALPMVLYVALLAPHLSAELFLALLTAVFAVLAFILYRYLKTTGSRLFETL